MRAAGQSVCVVGEVVESKSDSAALSLGEVEASLGAKVEIEYRDDGTAWQVVHHCRPRPTLCFPDPPQHPFPKGSFSGRRVTCGKMQRSPAWFVDHTSFVPLDAPEICCLCGEDREESSAFEASNFHQSCQ